MKPSYLNTIFLILFTALAAGCATAPKEDSSNSFPNKTTKSAANNKEIKFSDEDPCLQGDPYEKFNRRFYEVTEDIDRGIFEPVADSYIENIPDSVRESVGNFYSNLAYPNVALNALLQGKVKQGIGDGLRFIVNTTVGLGGIFDPAASLGLEKNDEDFGQTLGVWGVDNTSYMYIPILGPSSNRDLIGLPVTIASNMLFYAGFFVGAPITVPLGLLAAVDKRAQHTEQMRIRDQAALDRYIFTREAYWQYRENLVFDGKPPTEAYDSLFIDEDLSDTSDSRYFKEPCPEKSS
ncbi:MAG: VacJ family lipoprotein [Nitrosomonadaceae bacterium]|nr:VacJ family lipoprotein [Nitrosomonadaceae bacterium]